MNDFAPFEPMLHGTSVGGVIVRPAGPDDVSRVARLLTLRGISAEEAREQAPRMIDALPVLLLALLSAAEAATGDDDGSGVADDETAAAPDDALLAPVALSGAFPLPERMRASLPEASADSDAWMVSGLVVDPVARRRGVGRVLLTAIADAVRALEPVRRRHLRGRAGRPAASNRVRREPGRGAPDLAGGRPSAVTRSRRGWGRCETVGGESDRPGATRRDSRSRTGPGTGRTAPRLRAPAVRRRACRPAPRLESASSGCAPCRSGSPVGTARARGAP